MQPCEAFSQNCPPQSDQHIVQVKISMLDLVLLVQQLVCHDIGVHSVTYVCPRQLCICQTPNEMVFKVDVEDRLRRRVTWGEYVLLRKYRYNELPVEIVNLRLIIGSCLYVVKYIRPQLHTHLQVLQHSRTWTCPFRLASCRAVNPYLSRASRLGPFLFRKSTTSGRPWTLVPCNKVRSSSSKPMKFYWFSSKISSPETQLLSAARNLAMPPLGRPSTSG